MANITNFNTAISIQAQPSTFSVVCRRFKHGGLRFKRKCIFTANMA